MANFSSDVRPLLRAEDLLDAGLRGVYLKWNEERGGALGPVTMDLLELAEAIDRCMIIDLKAGKPVCEATVRFAGSDFARIMGHEAAGLPFSSFERYPVALKLISTCAEKRMAVVAGPHRMVLQPDNFRIVELICLPLSKDDEALTGFLYAFATHDIRAVEPR